MTSTPTKSATFEVAQEERGCGVSKFKYLYGPVASWRLGRSLGVDLISSEEKVCSFNCPYCQLGTTGHLTDERRVHVPTDVVMAEIKQLPDVEIDYITFSGMGEPTLAANLGDVVRAIKKLRTEPIAILTNSSLIEDARVQADLALMDRVIAKLDAATQGTFERVSRPASELQLTAIIRGLRSFRTMYKGQLDLQMMFTGNNEHEAKQMADLARLIEPDCVELNTPLRACGVEPLSKEQLAKVQECFAGMNVRNVYERGEQSATPLDATEVSRRGRRKS